MNQSIHHLWSPLLSLSGKVIPQFKFTGFEVHRIAYHAIIYSGRKLPKVEEISIVTNSE